MDQDIQMIRAELKKVLKLTEDNNVLLKRVDRRARLAVLWSVFRWAIVIGVAVGAFYYIQPYLEQLGGIYQSLTGNKFDIIEMFRRI